MNLHDWRLVLHRYSASVPPPNHYEYRIEISPDGGQLVYRPGYAMEQPPTWEFDFPVSSTAVAALERLQAELQLYERAWPESDEQTVGGALTWLVAERLGQRRNLPARLRPADSTALAPLLEQIRQLVPEAVWAQVQQQRAQYLAEWDG